MTALIVGLAIVIQLVAAVLALRLVAVTGKRLAWILIAIAILLMLVRRSITFYQIMSGYHVQSIDLVEESVTLLISAFILAGIAYIGPIFAAIHDSDKAIKASEARYQSTLENMLEGCQIIGQDWRYLYLNDAAGAHGREPKEALVGRTMMEVYPGIENTDMFAALRRTMLERSPCRLENEFSYPDAETAWFELSVQPVPEGIFILSIDVTKRKQAEQELLSSAAKLNAALSSMTDAVFISDTEGRFINFNDAFETFHKFKNKAECAKTFDEYQQLLDAYLADGRLAPVDMWAVPRALRGETGTNVEYGLRRKDTGEAWVGSFSFAPIRDNAGSIVGSVVVGRDITESKAAEEALRESEDKFKYVFDYSILGKSITLPTGQTNVNQAFCDMLGYTKQEFQSKPWQEITYPDDIQLTQKEVDALLSGEKDSARFIKRYIHKNGQPVWVDASTSLRRDKQGQPLYFVTAVMDITERVKAEETVRSLARFTTENPNPVLRLARDGALLFANQSAFNLLGPFNLQLGKQVPDQLKQYTDQALHKQGQIMVELPCGERIYSMSFSSTPAEADINVYARDVTERVKAAQEVRQLNAGLEQRIQERTAQLESANKELEAFSYSVSHDLRAPLRAMDGFSRILLEEYIQELPNQAQRYLHLVRENAQQMGYLIEDLLAFSRLSRQPVERKPIQMASLVQEVLEDLANSNEQHPVQVVLAELPDCEGDRAMLKQVWVNLLANAYKFTRKIEHARIEVGAKDGAYFVRDNGVGFDMQYYHKLFGVFQRLHRAEDYEGTGVGLAIVQRIVHRHGGRTWADAKVGEGATFYFTIEGGKS